MANPPRGSRSLKYSENQTIVCNNFTEEEVEELAVKLLGPDKAPVKKEKKEYPNVALSTVKDKDGWKFVIVKYDPNTGQAMVESMEKCGTSLEAYGKFKISAIKMGIVK